MPMCQLFRSSWGSGVGSKDFCWSGCARVEQWHSFFCSHCSLSVPEEPCGQLGLCRCRCLKVVTCAEFPSTKKICLIGGREEERWCDNPDKDVRQMMQSLHKLGHENKFSTSTETKTHFFLENKSRAERNSENCAKVDKHGKIAPSFDLFLNPDYFSFYGSALLGIKPFSSQEGHLRRSWEEKRRGGWWGHWGQTLPWATKTL